MNRSRRDVLALGGAALPSAIGLPGCIDGGIRSTAEPGDRPAGPKAMAAFFTLYDFTRQVAGETLTVDNAVPVGQHGHAWEPQADILPKLVESDAFVHLGIPGFQRWVDNAVKTLRSESDVVLIDAVEDVDLRSVADGGTGGGDRGRQSEHEGVDHENHGDSDEGEHQPDGEAGHDHDGLDPHYWLDPVAARRSVETIFDGIVDIDPGNGERYERNATDYLARLDELHRQFESMLEGRTHDLVVVAGHNSYRYLGSRYSFDIHSPTGVSPNADADYRDIEGTIRLIEDRGIEHVLYDHFEGDSLARRIAQDVEADVEVTMISSAESITREWADRGWGYVEQMEEINLVALRDALGVD